MFKKYYLKIAFKNDFKHENDIHEIYEIWEFLGHIITFLKF